ncbi:MAG: M10 family metallopeptidase C-terminal domain-containing protein [Pseudomonas fluorescens]|nr:M10 family metallopeptidase C-terminal domain-containing protein [Pseudomonas fluorescens]
MIVATSASVPLAVAPQPANSSPTPADTNTPAAADTYYNGVANLGRNPVRWIDKDGNGKIDIEVDFSAGPGKYFRKLGLTGYSQLSPEQKRELLDQMADLSFDTNLVFHEKGAIKNPDGKINFGNYAHVPSNGKNLVQVDFPDNTSDPQNPDKVDEPAEAYVRGDARHLKANARNRGGNVLAHALLHALGLSHTNPEAKSNRPASATDSLGYSLLSTQSETTTGHDFKGHYVTRAQMHDLGLLTQRYGHNSQYSNETTRVVYDLNGMDEDDAPVTTSISTVRAHETLNIEDDTHDQNINLNHGTFSSIAGFKNNISILRGTHVEDVLTGYGTNTVIANFKANKITLGSGANTVTFNNSWDSTPKETDHLVGFKSGIDKVDISGFSQKTNEGTFLKGNPHLDTHTTPDGKTYVRYWTYFDGKGLSEPDFLLRADGIKMSDIITRT